jgi:hypothetical protein
MPTTPKSAENEDLESQWRAALVHAEQLRLEYSHQLDAIDVQEPELDHLWLELWSAERRREDLFRAID